MSVRLNGKLIRQRIDELHGGSVTRLADCMNVSRSTLFRWLNEKLTVFPRSEHELCALGVALGVDPALLWRIPRGEWPVLCQRIQSSLRSGNLGRLLPALKFAEELLAPAERWPPASLARPYGHPWHTMVLAQRPAGHHGHAYHAAVLTPAGARGRGGPAEAWHFAFRDVGAPAASPFEPLGLVTLVGRRLALFAYNGQRMEVALPQDGSAFSVELWEGERTLEYHIASLHGFHAGWSEGARRNEAKLRFCVRNDGCEQRVGEELRRCSLYQNCEAYRPLPGPLPGPNGRTSRS